jgi:hypothetical protein
MAKQSDIPQDAFFIVTAVRTSNPSPLNIYNIRKVPYYGMLHSVVLAKVDVSEERTASMIRVTRSGELGRRHTM